MIHEEMKFKEITEPQIFNPPKEMLVWDFYKSDATRRYVVAIIPGVSFPVTTVREGMRRGGCFKHCAEIPEEPKPRRATNRELAKWLAQGNGQKSGNKGIVCISYSYGHLADDCEIDKNVVVRKWGDAEWHEPDVQYMGIEEESV